MKARVELYRSPSVDHVDQRLQWRWRFVARNGRIMADSGEGYARRIDCLNGCATVLGGTYSRGKGGPSIRPTQECEHIARAAHTHPGIEAQHIPVRDLTREAAS